MTGKERTMAALERRKLDRFPKSLRCTKEAQDALLEVTGTTTKQELYDYLNIDFRWIGVPFIGPSNRAQVPLGGEGYDFWGCYNKGITNNFNTYYEITYHPLGKMTTVGEIENYDWPDLDWWDYSAIPEIIKREKQKDDTCIMYFAGGAFESPWYMRGMEQFLIDIYTEPEIAEAISRKVAQFYYQRALRVLEAAEGQDGAISPVINDFIEMGLDVLDPIQVGAAGMTPEELYPAFGDRLSFHGAIDEVELLPHASPQEVYDETQRVMSILGQNNGFIVSPTHQVQGDTSPENVLAIYKAVDEFKMR